MSGIAGGFYCVEDKARDLIMRIEEVFAETVGPAGEPITEETRREEAALMVARELREMIVR